MRMGTVWTGSGLARRAARPGGGALRRALALALVAAGLAAATAAHAAAIKDEDCLMCHGDRSLKRSAPRPETSVFVDGAAHQRSVHRGLACVDCHRGIAELPHKEVLGKPRCESCHEAEGQAIATGAHARARNAKAGTTGCEACHGIHDVQPAAKAGVEYCARCHGPVVEQYRASVHAQAIAKGDTDASQCKDCHGSVHTVKRHLDPAAPTNRANLAETCAKCHADRALVTKRRINIPEAVELYRNSVHGRSKDPHAATCNDCHESHDLKTAADHASSIHRENIPKTCGKCHAAETKAYETGVHGTALARGVTKTPVCTDCHGEHRIRGPHDPSSPMTGGAVTATCVSCHEATGIRETFGLPAGRLSSYQDSFHGLAARGGSPVVANCASCHGYHDILPSTDPRSAVSPANLQRTCGKCHPGTSAEFAKGSVHVPMARPEEPLLHWIRIVYLWLIGGTIGGMAAHQGLDFVKKLRLKLRQHLTGDGHAHHEPGTRTFVRMTGIERLQHAMLAVSFLTLVWSGFALKFPESFLFSWLAQLEHGYALRSWIHRVAAIVMTLASFIHIGYLFTARGRGLLRDMVPTIEDGRFALHNMMYLVGLKPTPPPFKRFGYIEKAEYWALVWGTVVMTVTGLILWFENEAGRVFGRQVFDASTLIHYYEAWLAFLAIVVWHFYQNIVNPDVYPMNWTWITGRISEEQLRHEHGGEWAEIMARERAEAGKAETPEARGH